MISPDVPTLTELIRQHYFSPNVSSSHIIPKPNNPAGIIISGVTIGLTSTGSARCLGTLVGALAICALAGVGTHSEYLFVVGSCVSATGSLVNTFQAFCDFAS